MAGERRRQMNVTAETAEVLPLASSGRLRTRRRLTTPKVVKDWRTVVLRPCLHPLFFYLR